MAIETKVIVDVKKNGKTSSSKTNSMENAYKKQKEFNKEASKSTNIVDKLGNTLKKATPVAWVLAIKEATESLIKLTERQSEYVENLNMMQVAFGDAKDEASSFIQELSDAIGLDPSPLTKQIGVYRQIADAMGYTAETSDLLSKNLTKMQLDISSLFNLEFEQAGNALESAITGQVKTIRSLTGADITEATLKQHALALGIDKSVESMTRAEKTILIYLSLEKQLGNANGDLANTINSVSNQTKIFKEQITIAARQIGGLFIPILKLVLPLLNGIIMAFNTIIGMLLSFFGIDADSLNNEFGVASGGLNEIEEGLNGITNASKEAKKGLRGFDKLNNITTPSSGSGSGGGGIDPKLLAALDEYDLKLAQMKHKSAEIRDTIMEWLGFSRDVNGQWKLTEITFGGILTSLGTVLITMSSIQKISKLLSKFGLLPDMSKLAKFFKGTTGLSSGLGAMISGIGGIVAAFAGVYEIVDGIKGLLDGDILDGVLDTVEGIALVVGGIALLFGGWGVAAIAGLVALTTYIIEWCAVNWELISGFFISIWTSFLDNFWNPVVNVLTTIGSWIYDNVIKPIIGFFKPILEAITNVLTHAMETTWDIVSGIGEAMFAIVEKTWEIFAKIVEIFVELGKAFYEYALKPIIDWLAKAATWIWDKVFTPILKFFKQVAIWFYDHVISPIWDKVLWIKDKITVAFEVVGTFVVDFIGGSLKAVMNGIFSLIENTVNFFIKMINGSISAINAIPGVKIDKLDLLELPRLADGGFVNEGQMFVAREKGPEMVGTINGQTAVANNDQIVEAISVGVAKAMMASQRKTPIQITAEGDTSGLLNFIKFKEKEEDRQYGLG